jgi:hypothetical protein
MPITCPLRAQARHCGAFSRSSESSARENREAGRRGDGRREEDAIFGWEDPNKNSISRVWVDALRLPVGNRRAQGRARGSQEGARAVEKTGRRGGGEARGRRNFCLGRPKQKFDLPGVGSTPFACLLAIDARRECLPGSEHLRTQRLLGPGAADFLFGLPERKMRSFCPSPSPRLPVDFDLAPVPRRDGERANRSLVVVVPPRDHRRWPLRANG